MKRIHFVLALAVLSCSVSAQINLKKVKSTIEKKTNTGSTGLSNDDIVKGLKEALSVGTNNATNAASKMDAYYKNPLVFIPFPPDAKKAETKLRQLGYGKKVDEFTMTLNRAAENAAKEAAPIFLNAIKQLTITDGLNILNGANNAATEYLRSKTTASLTEKFKPIISNALTKVSATKYWTELTTTYNKIPRVSKVNTDLAAYTTDLAIKGLFKMIADEEGKIRKDPAARVSDILKKVFGTK